MHNKKKQNRKHTHPQRRTEHTSRNDWKRNVALRYAELGLPILPLHGTKKDGRCTCGEPACDQPGRHPRTRNGLRDATSDPQLVWRMWTKWPKAKIGIALGGASKLLALVTDSKDARRRLGKIITAHGAVPTTVTVWDGDRRISLLRGDGRSLRHKELAEGVRILGEGDFIVAPSSFASSGHRQRRFAAGLSLDDVEIAQAPEWLLRISAARAKDERVSAPLDPLQMQLVRSSEIEPKPIHWIWPSVIASGRVTALAGDPGLGKSQVAMDIAATVSTGRNWPGAVANDSAGDVIILSAEHDSAEAIVPRLMAAGADLTRIHIPKAVNGTNGLERAFDLTRDLDQLTRDLDQAKLLIVDPVNAYLRPTKGQEVDRVRSIQAPLARFAQQHDLAVVVIWHLSTSTGTTIMRLRSQEWAAAPRAVFLVAAEPGTARRLFLPLKNDNAPDRIGYSFEIVSKMVGESIRTSTVEWSSDRISISAEEALAAGASRVRSGAIDFLRKVLSNGPMDQTQIARLGKEAGYSQKQLRTAKRKLRVMSNRKGGIGAKGRWVWSLPMGAPMLNPAR
jgi:putative DNA primase/helicase